MRQSISTEFCTVNRLISDATSVAYVINDRSKISCQTSFPRKNPQYTMASSSDEDYEPATGHSDASPAYNLRRRSSGSLDEVVRTNSARKKLKKDDTAGSSAIFPKSAKALTKLLENVSKRLRSKDVDEQLSLRVVHMSLKLRLEHLTRKRKAGDVKAPAVRDRVCLLMGISTRTYHKVVKEYLTNRASYTTEKRGNDSEKDTRIPNTKTVVIAVREFVREKRSKQERVTARQVLDFFVHKNWIVVPRDNDGIYEKKAFASAYRSVRRWLERNEYRRGKRTGKIVMKAHVAAK